MHQTGTKKAQESNRASVFEYNGLGSFEVAIFDLRITFDSLTVITFRCSSHILHLFKNTLSSTYLINRQLITFPFVSRVCNALVSESILLSFNLVTWPLVPLHSN